MSEYAKFKEQAASANVVPVVETLPADLLTPLAVYLKLADGAENSFLLESVEGGETLARYSFIGANPHSIVTGGRTAVSVSDADGERSLQVPMQDFLRGHFANYHASTDPALPSFVGGAIGYLGFACSKWFEPSLNTAHADVGDDAALMFYRSVVAFDHARQLIKIISLVMTDEAADDESNLRAMYDSAVANNRAIQEVLEHPSIPGLSRANTTTVPSEVSANWSKAEFENAVLEIKKLINAGECYQVVVSQCFSKATTATPVSIYRAIRSLNPSPYMFLLKMGGKAVIGASPEMLVRSRGTRLEYRPIAGTRPRGRSPEEDNRLAEEMRADHKEVAEHLMLVDLGRNDLGRVAAYGSVKVDKLMNVEKYSHVQHLVSYLSAELRSGFDRFDALASCFPAGTVSGAPKVRAIELIQSMEPTPRGVYAGAVGYFDYSGNMDTCIAIRTLVLENGVAKVQSGGGVVADSVPELEYLESKNKARALLKAIEIAEGSAL
ncbi:MAG: anthranilate synthase component I family protein [Acidobacteriota bacterium]